MSLIIFSRFVTYFCIKANIDASSFVKSPQDRGFFLSPCNKRWGKLLSKRRLECKHVMFDRKKEVTY